MKHLFTMKYLNRMKYINTMKHIITMKSRKIAICVFTLLCVLCVNNIYAEDRSFGSGELLYFKAHPSSWSTYGDGDYHYFAYFYKGVGNMWSSEAVPVAGLPELMQVYAPEGTWSHVILVRKTDANPNWDGDKVQTGDIPLNASKNYLHNFKQGGTDNDWRYLRAIRVFDGAENFYINRTPSSWSGFGSGLGSSTHAFLYFFNEVTGDNAWSDEVTDDGGGNSRVAVPAGTWTHVIIVRKTDTSKSWTGTFVQTGNIALHDCFNYLYDFKQSSSDDWWLALLKYSSSDKLYIKKCPNSWPNFCDGFGSTNHVFAYFFNKKTGANGWSSEATEYEPGFLEVTPPTGTWTHVILTRQKSSTPGWGNLIADGEQSKDIALEENCYYIHDFRKNADPSDGWWKWISMGGMVPTTTTESFYNGLVKREQLDVCADAYANSDPLSLTPPLQDDKKDYNFVEPHVWFKWNGSQWAPVRDDWGNIWVPLSSSDPDDMFFFMWSNYNAHISRFLHVHRKDCPINCEITSFEYVITPVNVTDSTFAIEGIVAFTKQAGDLVISYGDSSVRFSSPETTPVSPQIFSLRGLKADNVERTLRAQFTGTGGWTADSLVTAPGPNEGVITHNYDDPDAETHYSIPAESFIHGSTITLTPHTDIAKVDSFTWTDSSGRLLKNGKSGDCTYEINKPGNIYMHELGADTTLVLYYTEYNLPPMDEGNLMENGDYETIPFNYDPTSEYEYTKDYGTGPVPSASTASIIWDGVGDNKNVYEFQTLCGANARVGHDTCYYFARSSLFGVATNANYFWNRFAHIDSRETTMGAAGTHLAVFDGDKEEKVAWRATSGPANPKLKLQQGSTYMFSFWVANVNNFGEMIAQGNTNNAILQFKIHYKDKSTGTEYEQYLGDSINLNDPDKYLNNFWHQNSATFTSPVDADEVTISVVDKNRRGLRIGNDFALDDIRFRTVSIQSATVRAREKFIIKYEEPKTEPVNLKVEWATKPACGQDTCTLKVSFRYPNITMHDIKLILKDINTVNSFGTLVDKAVLSKTSITGNPDSTDYVAYFTSGTYAGATYNEKVKADAATHNFKAQLIVLDAEEIDHGDYTNATLGAIAKPVLEIKRCEVIAPTCGYETYSLEVDVDYTAQSGAELKYYIDDVSKGTPKSITYEVTSRSKNDVTLYSLPADGKEHTLKVTTGDDLDCIATTKFTAPMANTITAFAVEPIQPDCDVETYTLRATWTVTKPADGVYDALMIKVGTATPYEIPITASNATGDNAKFDIPITYTIGDDHPAIKAYMKERGSSCYETGTYSDPTTPRMTIGDPTFEDIECNKGTFDLVVPVTYTYQHGRMWAWIDDKTSEKIEITASGNCKTGGAYQGYLAESTSSRTTYIVFNDVTLSGDHKVSVECDGEHSCHRTKALGTAKDFTAPLLPKASLVTPITMPSVAACDQLTFDLTVSIKFTNQDGDLQVKVDDGSWNIYYTPSDVAGEGKYIRNTSEQTKSVKLTGLPADGGTTHKIYYRFNKEGYCGYDTPLESDELTFPQSPTVTSTTVSATPSAVACDATDYTRTVTVEYKNGYGKKIIVEDEEGNELYKSSAALTSSNGTITPTVTLTAIDGASHYVIAYFEGYSCKSTDPHKGTYTAPVKPIITDVTVTSVSDKTCGAPEYTVSGTVSYTNVPSDTKITVAYDATHKTEITVKIPASDTKEFSISGITATGSELTVQAYFNSTTCSKTSNKFASPTAPSMEIKNIKQSTPGCDDLKYNLTFDVDYTYQYGNLTVHVDTYGDTVITIPETSRKKATLQTVHVTYTGKIPADGNTHTLTAQFGGTGSCSSSKTLSAVLSPVITDLSVSVPTDPIDCEATSYLASVTVETEYAIGKHVYIVYKNKSDEDVKYGPYEITESPQTFSSLSFADVGAITPRSVRVYLSERDTCEKTRSYSIPPTTSIEPFTVGITDRSTCDGVLYDIEGDIAYTSKPADANPAVRFGTYNAAMTAIGETSAHYKFTGVTTEGEDLTVEAYFTNKPKCFVSSDKFNSPLKPDVEAVNQKMADPVCNETTTSLTFDIRYTKQPAGTLTVWLDDAPVAKHQEISYMANDGSETPTTIEDVTISGITADGNTHTLHIKFSNGCTRTFTTPVAKFSPKITSEDVSITGESCGSEYYTATVTFNVANGQGKDVTVTGKNKTDAKAAVDGENTFVFTNVKRTYSDTSDDLFEIYFDDAQPSCSHIVASFSENPFKPIPTVSLSSVTTPQCYPAGDVTVAYTHTDAAEIKYTVKQGSTVVKAEETVSASGSFTFTPKTGGAAWAAETYNVYVTPVSAAGCVGVEKEISFVINPKPVINSLSVESVCKGATKAAVEFTATDATHYTYYIVDQTTESAKNAVGDGKFDLEIPSLLEAGTYKLHLVAHSASCESAAKEVDLVIHPLPSLSIAEIGNLCYPTNSVEVTYTQTNTKSFTYTVKTKDGLVTKISDETVTVDATQKFTITTDTWAAGEYTLTAVAKSNNGCTINADPINFTILPKPAIEAIGVGSLCKGGTAAYLTLNAKNATHYRYYIVGKTALSDKIAIGASIVDLPSDLEPGKYKFKLVALSETCHSDTAECDFNIWPLPTFTFKDEVAHDCHPSSSISVGYKSTNTDTYSYTLTKEGAGSPAQTVTDQPASDEGIIVLNTSELAAGTYNLVVTAKSVHNCELVASVTKVVTIYDQPTVDITSVENHCEGSAEITVNYTSEDASNYTYEVVGTTLSGHGAAEASGSFKIDISDLEDGDYKLRMHVTSAHAPLTCDGTSDEYDFTIWAVPEVGFITPLPIKEGVASVTVTLQLQDAETYDWRFMDGSTELESGNNVPAGQTTVTLTTGSLDEGTYSLFVTPKTSHCAGEEREVHVVVNNKPTINFTEPDIVCAGSSTLNVEYSTSPDATDLYYTIKQGATTVVSEQHVDLTATASPLPVNISGLTYGTYTLTGYVKSALETGDVSSTDFTLIAVPTLNKVTQDLAFIGCEETYDATIKVNIFNAAGRKIYAKYTDDGEHTLHVETSVGDPTATINLTDLTHTDLSEKHEVKVYVDGFEDCGLTVGYDEPKLKTITKDFEVTPLPKSCGDEKFTITGTVVANCNEGKIVVEYNDTYKDIVDASTSGSDFTIADIPAGGSVTKLKAYFQGKTCGVVESAEFAEPTKPEASIAYTPYVTPLCDVTTFNLEFTLDYTYQEAGTLTVWVDEDHKNTYNSADSKYEVLAAKTQLTGTIEGLPADGRTGQKLYFEFSGSHSCKGSIDLDAFPQTPLITGTDIDNANIPQVVPGVDGTYPVTVTVTYELAIGERLVLEYFDKDDQAQHAYSTTAVTGSGSYEFNLTFNDVAVTGDRFVNAYFEGSSCTTGGTHTDTYTAPSNSSAKFESLELTNISSCDALLYNLTGTISFIGAAVGDLIVEFDANHTYTIPEADCVAGENIPFAINGVDVPIPAEGQQLKVYFSDLPNNKSYSEEVYQPVIPTMAISDSAYSTPACNSTTTTLTFALTYLKQQGNLHVAVDGAEQDYTLSDDLKLNDETTRSLTVTVADQPADMAVRQLTVWFDGDKSCSRTVTLPQAPFGPQITGGEAVASNFTCGSDVYDVTVTVTTANHLGKDLTLICHDQTKVVPVTGSPMSVLFTDINRTIDNTSDDFIELYFADASNAADCADKHTQITYTEPAKPALEADVKVDTVFTCGSKQYNFTVTIASENQPGTCYVLDSIVGGEVRTMATHEGAYNGSDAFSLALPATNELHLVIVRYPATNCEIISPAIDINTYTKPKPLISLTAIDRLCNSETELSLPFAITQGDIAEATLTLTDSKGKTVITAADLTINDSKDTLSYALTSQLAAGKYTVTVEAHDTLDCETSASQSIEFALDGVVFSKWTDVLLVDNADGAFTGYQWYENGVQLDGQTGQVLYLPEEGMVGKSYYCQLQTADGTIYTCEDVFDALPRSADNPKQPTANHITVLPNRVAANGAVTVRQSANENLHLILMSATGKRVAEYTQQESAKLVTMPGVQGIYLLRIEAESDAQTVKIVVY